MTRSAARWSRPGAGAAVVALGLIVSACGAPSEQPAAIAPEYDKETGRLRLLKYDADGDGKVDTVSYMDGARILRIEIDEDGDGQVDRWEHYGQDGRVEKVGFSRAGDGVEDAWSYAGADGSVTRLEISTARDGKVTRTEHYEAAALVRAEEDTDRDGRPDKWEIYEGGRLHIVAFDNAQRGTPDRRIVYGADGSSRFEIDPDGDGRFAAASPGADGVR